MEELYREYARTVYRFLFSMCGDRHIAEDLMQETFLRAYQSIERYNGECKMSVWLCQIARHLWYQYLQKNRHETAVDMDSEKYASPGESAEQQAVARYEIREVLRKMQKLPPRMREVMYLRLSGDLSYREIGEILGESENWARVNFYRGKEILWRELRGDERDKL